MIKVKSDKGAIELEMDGRLHEVQTDFAFAVYDVLKQFAHVNESNISHELSALIMVVNLIKAGMKEENK